MVVIFMPFLPNLAVFLGISVWYLVPKYWIVVIYRSIERNLAIWQNCRKFWQKACSKHDFIFSQYFLSQIKMATILVLVQYRYRNKLRLLFITRYTWYRYQVLDY